MGRWLSGRGYLRPIRGDGARGGTGVARRTRRLTDFDDHFYPEIVDPDTGEPVLDGELGELVITTLTKEAQPVIRYRTKDITRILPDEGSDGRTFTRLARLTGRADDMLIIRGVNVYPREIEAVLLDDPDIGGQYAIVVDRRQAMAELRIVTELASGRSNAGVVTDRLQADLLSSESGSAPPSTSARPVACHYKRPARRNECSNRQRMRIRSAEGSLASLA